MKARTKLMIAGALVLGAAGYLMARSFTDDVDVVAEGRFGLDRTSRATVLLAKCASRYENAPEKYQSTLGYVAARGSRA